MPPGVAKAPRRPRRHTVVRDGPRPVDVHVGKRVRLRRQLLGMSQQQLADSLDLTFQQIQKYESGANRLSAGRLYALATILDVPISFFFDDMPNDVANGPIGGGPDEDPLPPAEAGSMDRRETLELVRYYYKASPMVRRTLFELIKSLGRPDGEPVPIIDVDLDSEDED